MRASFLLLVTLTARAQVYSPVVTKAGQPDTSSIPHLVRDIYAAAHAHTPREKAEAIWHFYLTDGRFVKPGMIYHIAGWAYEEPKGEVLDPLKILNSYGFGLCYHIAPLLEATFEAGGFADARVWFLTGHTVGEVFYDGAYHYYDSDMMGYNSVDGVVASVRQLEKNGEIVTKQKAPSEPWYPADVRANAIDGLAELFTTTKDNWVFPFQRYSAGHTMDFVLRPGERMIRNFHPSGFYLPFADGHEFPREIAQYQIRTADGPRSQKDSRLWSTGRIEYRPPQATSSFIIDMPSPYVIIGAEFSMQLKLTTGDSLLVETSTDGLHWTAAGRASGPHNGPWTVSPAAIAVGPHGKSTAVSGTYSYQVRLTSKSAAIANLLLTTDFQLNPRTLPALSAGRNEFHIRRASYERKAVLEVPALTNAARIDEGGQGFIRNLTPEPGSAIFHLRSVNGFDAGARFLDLRDGWAPDKFTAEIRKIRPWPSAGVPSGSIAWSTSANGPWRVLWTYDPKIQWRDNDPIERTLRFPEVDRQVRGLPATSEVYVRFQFQGLAIDDFRLATYSGITRSGPLVVTHLWREAGRARQQTKQLSNAQDNYLIEAGGDVENVAIILESPIGQN